MLECSLLPTLRRVVDNRVCLLGLDWMYREAMKRHERNELRECAQFVAAALRIAPADVPVEGYYAEEPALMEYFRLVRALQRVESRRGPVVAAMHEFQRLRAVTASPIFGRSQNSNGLLPAPRDPLVQALDDVFPEWTVPRLTEAAGNIACVNDDISLVGLAARTRDAVLLAAMRESVVLYAETPAMMPRIPPTIEYIWQVDTEFASAAGRFVREFNALCNERLPSPLPDNAEHYWHAHTANDVVGRCVRLGYDDSTMPIRHYHWGIMRAADGSLTVQEFWDAEVWTTQRYSAAMDRHVCRPRLE